MSCESRTAANSCRVGNTFAHFCNFAPHSGPSGAGKSTLINVLAHTASGPLTGSVTSHPKMMRLPAYVKQEAYFLPTLTAAETVHLYCTLQRPGFSAKSRQEREDVVSQLLRLMGLQHSAGSQVTLRCWFQHAH